MSKRNKHHKPKGPKSPPQNVVAEEKPVTEQQPVIEVKPESEIKPSSVTETQPVHPQTEAKPEPSVTKEVVSDTSEKVDVKDNSKPSSSEVADSPVKPKRHRNRKNKHKDNQATAGDSKDDSEELLEDSGEVEKCVKKEEIKNVEKPVEVKSESSEAKDPEFKTSGRNKKKDKKDGNQHVPETSKDELVASDVQPKANVDVSKKGSKTDAQTQVKNVKGKQEEKAVKKETKLDDSKIIPTPAETPDEATSKSEEPIEHKEQQESKPERHKKGKNKKPHEDTKSHSQVESIVPEKKDNVAEVAVSPSELEIKDQIVKTVEEKTLKKETIQDSKTKDQKHGDDKIKEKSIDQSKESESSKSKGKHKQNIQTKPDDKLIDEDKEKQVVMKDEPITEKEVKMVEAFQSCDIKKCESPKSKKQKGKQIPSNNQQVDVTETIEDKSGLVSLSSILGSQDTKPKQDEEVPKSDNTLSVKKDRKSRSKTPEPKTEAKNDQITELPKSQDDEKKCDLKSLKNKNLDVNVCTRRSKTPEQPSSIQIKSDEKEKIISDSSITKDCSMDIDTVKEEKQSKLTPKLERKGRSKTPEITIVQEEDIKIKQDEPVVCEKKDETKVHEKCSKKQKGKDNIQHEKHVSQAAPEIQVSSEQVVLPEVKEPLAIEKQTLTPKEQKKSRSKTPEIKIISEIKEEKPSSKDENIIPSGAQTLKLDVQQSGKTMDLIKPCSKKQRKSRSKTPEVKIECTKSQLKKNVADDILPSIASSIEQTLEKLVSECDITVTDKKIEPLEKAQNIVESSEIKATAELKPDICPLKILEAIPLIEEKHGSDGESTKCPEKHKKAKKSGKKESKEPTEGVKQKEGGEKADINLPFAESSACIFKPIEPQSNLESCEQKQDISIKETIQKIEEFVIKNPISEDIISTLLSDVPPEFIDADVSDNTTSAFECHKPNVVTVEKTAKDEKTDIKTTSKDVCPLPITEIEKNICTKEEKSLESITLVKDDSSGKGNKDVKHSEEHDKGNKNKSKKHDKKKGGDEEHKTVEVTPKETAAPKDEQNLCLTEPSTPELQPIETHKSAEADSKSEPKPTKRNKDKKHKNDQHKECHTQPEISTEKPSMVENKPEISKSEEHVTEIKKDVELCEKSKEICKPECESKQCETCPKKKKSNKGKVQTLEEELSEACTLEKTESKKEEKSKEKTETITPIDIIPAETSTKAEQKDSPQTSSEKFEFLKLPEETKVTDSQDSQTKDKNKRGSKSPAKQSKNLHGPSSSPAKSSKCDYKKEKNKGDKKCPPDINEPSIETESKAQETKCEKTGESKQCQKKCDKKGKQKTDVKLTEPGAEAVSIENIEDLEEEFVYKYSFRTVFIANACHVCKLPLKEDRVVCRFCHLVCYCTEGHRDDDWASHQSLCYAICTLSHVKAQEHIYGDAKSLSGQDYRLLRMQGIVSCEKILKRKLCPWEQEVLLYPRMCLESTCREWRSTNLKDCDCCGQVSYCTAHPTHLPTDHANWCSSYRLYHRLVAHQLHQGRIEPVLPTRIFQEELHLPDDTTNIFDTLYGEHKQMDECYHATLTQLSTAPLTALYAYQKALGAAVQEGHPTTSKVPSKPALCIHIIGAELQFEADTLNKWESFFLHLCPGLQDLRIVFIGPELNTSNLPVDLLSRIKMCQPCKQANRIVRFEFHDSMLYHDFIESSKFSKPDLICAFNPGFHRATGYAGLDTWPETIAAALRLRVLLCVTAYTQFEMPRDLARIYTVCPDAKIKFGPFKNPYTSLRPDRNFISDDEMPLIFKNYHLAVVSL